MSDKFRIHKQVYEATKPNAADLKQAAKAQEDVYQTGKQLSSFTEMKETNAPRKLFVSNHSPLKSQTE